MEIILSGPFLKHLKKIKDRGLRVKILKSVKKLAENPRGKHLKYGYKGNMRLRIGPFRIFYRIEKNTIRVTNFEHRKKAY